MLTFMGYLRPDGQVGVRNHVMIMPITSEANGIVRKVVRQVPELISLAHTSNDFEGTSPYHSRLLRGLTLQPNYGAVILVGIGYERDNAKALAEELSQKSGKPVFGALVKEDGGSEKVIDLCVEKAREFLKITSAQERVPCPVSKIIMSEQCAGSDALSGLTANQAIGKLSDWLIENGGTTILTEMEELKGCEEFLAARCSDPELADRIRENIKAWPMQPINKNIFYTRGGMSNILEKSLGCYNKGGKAPVTDLIGYAELIGDRKGLVLMDGTAADMESVAGEFATGSQIMVFSSGNGNPVGFPGCPVLKISANPKVFASMGGVGGDMDINAGAIINGEATMEDIAQACKEEFLAMINGKLSACEMKNNAGIIGFHRFSVSFA